MSELDINNVGNILQERYTIRAIKAGITYDVPPSLFICQWYAESNFGTTPVAVNNLNWGGSTWTGKGNRPSGVVVTKGTPRPASEGSFYMKFKTIDDYMTDYFYLLNEQGIYKISGKSNFNETVKGLFTVGGAKYNYGGSGVNHYIELMNGVRNGINSRNNNILDKIDNNPGNYVTDIIPPKPENPPETDPPIKTPITDKVTENNNNLVEYMEKMLSKNIYFYGSDETIANGSIVMVKLLSNMYQIKLSGLLKDIIIDTVRDGMNSLDDVLENDLTPVPPNFDDDVPPPDPPPIDGEKYFPVDFKSGGVNYWYPPHDTNLKKNMDFGLRTSGVWHNGFDIGGGGKNHKIYVVGNGKVILVDNIRGYGFSIQVEQDDGYFTFYAHLVSNSNVVNVGDDVVAGQHIATMGATGGNYAIHLHFEISKNGRIGEKGSTIDPKGYLGITADNKTSLPRPPS